MIRLPIEAQQQRELVLEFNRRFQATLRSAVELVEDRASSYDETPVWHRVAWPEGYLHEVRKKLGRVDNILLHGVSDVADSWEKAREEMLDMINYLAFAVAFGSMYYDPPEHLKPHPVPHPDPRQQTLPF
jgi:hypothetical protein